jgi:protein-tyrosine phosphatase
MAMNRIDKNLYLGSLEAALKLDKPHNRGKWFVLSIMEDPPKLKYLKQLAIHLSDHHATHIDNWFDIALKAIDTHLRQGKKVLVHCRMGISRSATMIIAHLMNRHGLTMKQAISHVERSRPIINPNPGFMTQLKIFEIYLASRRH